VLFVIPNCKPEEIIIQTQIETGQITVITDSTAVVSGYFTELSGNVSEFGHCWSLSSNPTISDNLNKQSQIASIGPFTSNLSQLKAETKYYVRAFAIDNKQTIYANELFFTTPEKPFIMIKFPDASDHWLSGETHTIEWDDNINENVTITLHDKGNYIQTIAENIVNNNTYQWILPDNLPYGSYYQIKIAGALHGNISGIGPEFKISEESGTQGSLIYWDVNYLTIKIGTQWWFAENLKNTKFNDGAEIPVETNNTLWTGYTSPAYCWYNNDYEGNGIIYGALYNWYTVSNQKICPEGWHVPNNDDWELLINYFGGENISGGILKETGTIHWNSPNTGATNESGFTALPGGYRNGPFSQLKNYGCWWSFSEESSINARVYSINYDNTYINQNSNNKNSGASVRCIRD
jgi:uncharacterized protein (TIGR02145 family)